LPRRAGSSAHAIFDASIDLQHRLIVPAVIAGLDGEIIPVFLMASGPDHHIDARAVTRDLVNSHGNGTSVQLWIGLALKAQSCSPLRREGHADASLMLATSSLPPASSKRTLTSAFSANRRATTDPDRSRAADDEVVVRLQLSKQLLLIDTDARGDVIRHDAAFYRVDVNNRRFS